MEDSQDTGGQATQDDASIVADALQTDDSKVVDTAVNGVTEWSFADGVKGEGEIPEWFKADKYKTVSEQAKAYKDLESRFGSFTGAPEEYADVEVREELRELGVEISKDDPIYSDALEFAKELNMNQDGFDKMINLYATAMAAETKAMENYKAEELKALGNTAETRINNLNAWASANLPGEMIEGFQGLAQSAEAVKTLERLVAMTRHAPISSTGATPQKGMSSEELTAMQFEKDQYGNRRIQTDKEFRKRFDEAAARVWGSEDHTIVI